MVDTTITAEVSENDMSDDHNGHSTDDGDDEESGHGGKRSRIIPESLASLGRRNSGSKFSPMQRASTEDLTGHRRLSMDDLAAHERRSRNPSGEDNESDSFMSDDKAKEQRPEYEELKRAGSFNAPFRPSESGDSQGRSSNTGSRTDSFYSRRESFYNREESRPAPIFDGTDADANLCMRIFFRISFAVRFLVRAPSRCAASAACTRATCTCHMHTPHAHAHATKEWPARMTSVRAMPALDCSPHALLPLCPTSRWAYILIMPSDRVSSDRVCSPIPSVYGRCTSCLCPSSSPSSTRSPASG